MGRIEGKVAFVSGGASGLGQAIVRRFVEEGGHVFFGDINEAGGRVLAAETGAHFLPLDVASEDQWKSVIGHVQDAHGRLDVVVNNAGITGTGPLETIDLVEWNRLFAINVTGVMLGCKYGSELMQQNPGGASGSIINISSNSGLLGTAFDCGYSATKGAVTLMTKSLGVNFARRGIAIRCNSIHPGPIDTPIFERWQTTEAEAAELHSMLMEMIPMKRLGRPKEIADMALFLASDEASFSTGSQFVVDGGSTSCLAGM